MRARRIAPLDAVTLAQRAYLHTGVYDTPGRDWWYWAWVYRGGVAATWSSVRDAVLQEWVGRYPGTRPWAWWAYDAPKAPVYCRQPLANDQAAQRQRLGGIGTPVFEALNYAPELAFGLPVRWVDVWSVRYYNGRAVDVHGKPIGTEYHEGHFPHDAIDAKDPPIFESQSAYLQRHDLFTPGEFERLGPDAFTPEAVNLEDGDQP